MTFIGGDSHLPVPSLPLLQTSSGLVPNCDGAGTSPLLAPHSERLANVGLDVELGERAVDLTGPRRLDILGIHDEAEPAPLDGGRVAHQAQERES
jgi:hypothetical protein